MNAEFVSQPVVLIVDDSADARQLLHRVLQKEGYKVLQAEDGLQGISLFEQHQPDVILMDAKMPVMDGFTACKLIKEKPLGSQIPLIMVTSLEDKNSIQLAFEAGATDYIAKPISNTILVQRVRHFLHSRLLEKSLAQRNHVLEHLNRAAQAAASSLDTQESLRQIIRVAGQALDVTSAYVQVYRPNEASLTLTAEYVSPYLMKVRTQLAHEGRVFGHNSLPFLFDWLVNPTNHLILKPDHEAELTATERQHYRAQGGKAGLIVPLYVEGALYGCLELWEARHERDFSPDDIALVIAIANQVGSHLQNTQLHSALKRSEAQLRRYAAELEQRNRELEAYDYTIAHDIKSPLQLILNYVVFALDNDATVMSEDSVTLLNKTEGLVRNMSILIDQLLKLSRMAAEEVTMRPVHMEAIVQQVLGQHEALIRARKVEIEVSRPLPPVLGHPLYVQEVLSNLVNNSLKYLGEDNPAPSLSISAQALGDYVRYSVRDNGIGIAQEDIDKLFRMFKRLATQTTEKVQGHGLGLSIVERFVKKMGGTVGVQSRLGEGSEFFITLPSANPHIPLKEESLTPR